MQIICLIFGLIAGVTAAADFLEDLNLFSEPNPSLIFLDDSEANDSLDYNDESKNMLMGNDGLDSSFFTEDECSFPLGSGPIGRIRGRTDQCSAPSTEFPQLQLPTLNDATAVEDFGSLDLNDGSALDSLKNEEICPVLVFFNRNIPICGSGNPSYRKFNWRASTYSLEQCSLCTSSISLSNHDDTKNLEGRSATVSISVFMARDLTDGLKNIVIPALNGCFFQDQYKSIYCCSKYEVKEDIGYAEGCLEMIATRLQGNYESLP